MDHDTSEKVFNNYISCVEDLCMAEYSDPRGPRLKFYQAAELDEKKIMLQVLLSKTGTPVARLLCFVK